MGNRCVGCGLGIHRELIRTGIDKSEYKWLHDDYKAAWMVGENGFAKRLHFAIRTLSAEIGSQETENQETESQKTTNQETI